MLNVSMADPEHNLRPRLTVVGVGGAGGNAINNMIRCGLEGCDFIAANTDSQALSLSLAQRKIQLGVNMSRGLGAGSKPDVGRSAAEEQMNDILACLDGSDMIFITAGMGGGTGTGAAPVIARAAREAGILTVGVVTKPFHFEGSNRMKMAEQGIAELQQYVDTLIVIPNQNLFRIANERTTFAEAFRLADEVLLCGVRGITDLMVMPGFMNLDFADVKTVMGEMGKAMMGTGEAEGENRAILAAEAAISNPLLDDVSMKGARGVLINITGGMDMTLFEVDQAANRIREEVDPEAQIKVGSTLGEDLQGRIRVSVIATGIDAAVVQPAQRSSASTGAVSPLRTVVPSVQQAPRQVVTPSVTTSQYFTMPQAVTPQVMAQQPPQAPVVQAPPAHEAVYQPAPVVEEVAQAPQFSAPPQPVISSASPEAPVAAAPVEHRVPTPQQTAYSPRPASPPQYQQRSVVGTTHPSQAAPAKAAAPSAPPAYDMRITQLSTPAQQTASDQRRMRRSESLFTRITGFGLVRPSAQNEQEETESVRLPDEVLSSQGHSVEPHLGISPADRPELSSEQPSDLLDIPAFLRRQTNH